MNNKFIFFIFDESEKYLSGNLVSKNEFSHWLDAFTIFMDKQCTIAGTPRWNDKMADLSHMRSDSKRSNSFTNCQKQTPSAAFIFSVDNFQELGHIARKIPTWGNTEVFVREACNSEIYNSFLAVG